MIHVRVGCLARPEMSSLNRIDQCANARRRAPRAAGWRSRHEDPVEELGQSLERAAELDECR